MNPNCSKPTALVAMLLIVACGASTTSPLVVALEGISIAADVGAPIVAALNPTAAAFVGLVPGVVTAALDIAEGKAPLATASTVAVQLQSVWNTGNGLLPGLSGTDKTVVSGILGAIQAGITLFNQQYGTTSAATAIPRAYAMGFVDTPNPATAKVKKLGKADKAAIASARKHLANVSTAVAKRKGGK